MRHRIHMSGLLCLFLTRIVSQSLFVFHDLDSFEEHWAGAL